MRSDEGKLEMQRSAEQRRGGESNNTHLNLATLNRGTKKNCFRSKTKPMVNETSY